MSRCFTYLFIIYLIYILSVESFPSVSVTFKEDFGNRISDEIYSDFHAPMAQRVTSAFVESQYQHFGKHLMNGIAKSVGKNGLKRVSEREFLFISFTP